MNRIDMIILHVYEIVLHVWKISRPRQMTISILKTLLQMLHLKTAESVMHRPHMICHNLLYLKEVATKCTMIFINKLSTCFILCYTSKQQQRNSSWIELIWSFYVCMRLYHVWKISRPRQMIIKNTSQPCGTAYSCQINVKHKLCLRTRSRISNKICCLFLQVTRLFLPLDWGRVYAQATNVAYKNCWVMHCPHMTFHNLLHLK